MGNPGLGKKVIGKTESGRRLYSNCYGTSIFLLGDNAIEECKQISKSQPFICDDILPIYYEDLSRPGLVEIGTMQEFLTRNYEIVGRPEPGDLVIIEKNDYDEYRLEHVAIWTGIDNFILSQDNLGGKFQLGRVMQSEYYTTYYTSRKDPTP